MRCPACNAENPAGAKFCMQCGAAPVAVCAACGQRNPPMARCCMECGSGLGAACSACSQRNPATARFCMGCGNRLAAVAQAAGQVQWPAAAQLAPAPALPPQPPAPPPAHEPAAWVWGRPAEPEPSLVSVPVQPEAAPPAQAPVAAAVHEPAPAPQSYTPKHLAEKILASRSAVEGERKQVTILFADTVGSTELVRDMDPEEAQALLDGTVRVMMDAVHQYEGTISRLMGDGLMALFGAPIAHEDHAVRACYAALAMQEAAARYAEQVRQEHGIPVSIRVGLNAGEVVVRLISDDLHMDYTALGQTVHLASRMEQLAAPGKVVLTPETLKLAEGYVQAQSLGEVSVKGLPEPMEAFELVGAGPIRTRLQASAARGLTRLVGREAELAALDTALQRAAGGEGQVVVLTGPAGMGKSRLIWEVSHSPQTRGWLVLESDSVSYGKATSYLPINDMLKSYCHIDARDDAQTIREKVTDKIRALDPALESTLPALLWLLDVPVDDPEWQNLDPPQRRRRTQDAVKQLVFRESEAQPLLLIVENIHWVDPETRAVLDTLVENLPSTRLIMLVSFRPEYEVDWDTKPYYTEIRIDSLSPEAAEQMLRALLGEDPGLRPLQQLLIERTQGNPFFLEETIRSLVETGALVGERGAHRLALALPSIRVPATVQAVLAARIDRLPPDEKRLLQSAAVIGRDVPIALLQAIADLPDSEFRRGLAQLKAAEFLDETTLFPGPEYTFKHALTQDVAYETLLQQRRRALHGQIVGAIEALYPERLTEHVGRLAQHAFTGEVWDKAVRYYRQSAAKSVSRAAYRAAVDNLERALAALERLPSTPESTREAIDIHLDLRSSLLPLSEFQRIHDHLREAQRLANELGDRRRLARSLSYLCQFFTVIRDPERAVQAGEDAVALARELDDADVLVPASFILGEALYSAGEFRRGVAVLEPNVASLQGVQRFERFGMTGLPAELSNAILAQCFAELGDFTEADAASDEATSIAEVVNHPYSLAHASNADGFVQLMRGDLARATRSLVRSLDLCRTWNLSVFVPASAARLGWAHVLAGRMDEGLPLLEQATRQAEAIGRLFEQASIVGYLSEAYLLGGRHEEALDLARRAFEVADAGKQRAKRAHILRLLGDIYAKGGPANFEQAEACYSEASVVAQELEMGPLQAHCHLGLGTLYRQAGRLDQSRSELSVAVELYRSMQMMLWLPGAEDELAAVSELARTQAAPAR